MKKRLLAAVMSLCMIVSLLPVSALAAPGHGGQSNSYDVRIDLDGSHVQEGQSVTVAFEDGTDRTPEVRSEGFLFWKQLYVKMENAVRGTDQTITATVTAPDGVTAPVQLTRERGSRTYYGSVSSGDWQNTTVPSGMTRVYLYVRLNPEPGVSTEEWKLNKDGWYTIGYLDVPDATLGSAAFYEVEHYANATQRNAVVTYLGKNTGKIVFYSDFVQTAFDLENIAWGVEGFGLKVAAGATDYPATGNQWHLDGQLTLKAEAKYSLTVEYAYAEGDEGTVSLPDTVSQQDLSSNAEYQVEVPAVEGYSYVVLQETANGSWLNVTGAEDIVVPQETGGVPGTDAAYIDSQIYGADAHYKVVYTKNTYTVTWMNGDTQLEKDDDVAYGAAPSYDGGVPTKESTAQYDYTFAGWSTNPNATNGTAEDALPTVSDNVTYYAIFTQTGRTYTVTWMNEDTQLEKDNDVAY